jgi:hypothetical protein
MTFGATISLALVLVATAICCAAAAPVADAEQMAPAKAPCLQCRLYFGCVPIMRPAANQGN